MVGKTNDPPHQWAPTGNRGQGESDGNFREDANRGNQIRLMDANGYPGS